MKDLETKITLEDGQTLTIKSIKGDNGIDGKDGIDGVDGVDGKDGKDGRDGIDGTNGKDGSPDFPDAIATKLNTLEKALEWKVIKDAPDFTPFETRLGSLEKSNTLKPTGSIDQRWKGGGISKVTTDATLTGLGTSASPLSVVPIAKLEAFSIAVSDEATALTTGTAKITFRMPYAMTLTEVRINVNTAPTGSTLIVDVKESGTTIFSTKPSIDASEKTSVTAATPPVISDSSLADDAEMTVNIDQVGASVAGKGLKLTLIGTRT